MLDPRSFRRGFVLLRFGNDFVEGNRIVKAADSRRLPLSVCDISDAKIAELYERWLVLVRPDGHVALRGDVCPDDSDSVALIDQLRGAASAIK